MFTIKKVTEVEVKKLRVSVCPRYWEDAIVNGHVDEDGVLIPFRYKDCWCPVIDLATGIIDGCPIGTTAEIHYKVCDEGKYQLLGIDGVGVISEIDGYVPEIMCPEGEGYGDYIIMKIDSTGQIDGWEVVLSEFNLRRTD